MSSAYGPIILGLVILSILLPILLIPAFNLWYTSGILLLIFGLAIIILASFWFVSQKKQNLSLSLPITSLVAGILIFIVGFIIIGTKYITRVPQILTTEEISPFTLDECIDSIETAEPGGFTQRECNKFYGNQLDDYTTCKGLVEAGRSTGVNPPLIQRDITIYDSCQSGCKRSYQKDRNFPIEVCYENCKNKTNCLKFPKLGPVIR